MSRLSRVPFSAVAGFSLLLVGCGSAAPKQPPGAPPSPESITREEPGGDAFDPHFAALTRQEESSWGWRTDKDNQARFPLPDRRKWRRVRFFLIDHFVGFTYGKKDPHAYSVGFVVELPEGAPRTSAACVQQFEIDSLPKVNELGGKLYDLETNIQSWNERPLVVRRASGTVRFMLKRYDAALAWTGYPAYANACLVYALAVPWEGHQELAENVRDKWSDEGFARFKPLTEDPPFRHP
jgi:hypothetical protein